MELVRSRAEKRGARANAEGSLLYEWWRSSLNGSNVEYSAILTLENRRGVA